MKIIHKQDGFAAIITTMIIMVILTVITIGFVAVVSREQRQSQDRQLSTQAFYAAETGVNDAVEKISATGFPADYKKVDCAPDAVFTADDHVIDLDSGVTYSCLLIQSQPRELEYGNVGLSTPVVAPINPVNEDGTSINPDGTPVTINRLEISWEGTNATGSPFRTPGISFPAATAWNTTTGVLRVNLTSTDGPFTRSSLQNNTFTSFLYPNAGGLGTVATSSLTAPPVSQGTVNSGNCNNGKRANYSRFCVVRISLPTSTNYMIALRSIYTESKVTIKAFMNSDQKRLSNAQVVIDSTGKSNDVLRRIAVRVPKTTGIFPGFALESIEDVCKQFGISPTPPGGSTAIPPCTP